MLNIEENLRKYNITIPKANKPVANYSPYVKTEKLIFISGQIPITDGNMLFTGKVNKDLEISSAVKAAELCMLNSFAILKDAVQNNLNLVNKCVKINVFINSDDSFLNQPEVADGASNLITKIMSPNSNHARSAVSVNSLPKNATVEIDSVFEIAFER
jgi:enamine deaminase RidA (YjgF/YER057c/UK114 family)